MGAPVDALETLMAWLERDDDEAAIELCDQLNNLFGRTDLEPAQARQRLVELLRHMVHALDQVTIRNR
jgi:thioredoxin-like negative regulator of GroEL